MSNARSPFGRDPVDDRSRKNQSMSSARGPDEVQSSPGCSVLSREIASKAVPDCDIPGWARAPTDGEPSTGGLSKSRQSAPRYTNFARASTRSPIEPNPSRCTNRPRHARRATLQPLLTVTEVAAVLNVSAKTIRRLAASGSLQTVRIGRSVRVRPRDIERVDCAMEVSAMIEHFPVSLLACICNCVGLRTMLITKMAA